MVKNKDDKYYINKIVECINVIEDVSKDKTIDDVENDVMLNSTIMFQFILIGEYSLKISDDYKNVKKEIEWNKVKGLRNNVVHNYDGLDYKILYDTIKIDLPKLKENLKT